MLEGFSRQVHRPCNDLCNGLGIGMPLLRHEDADDSFYVALKWCLDTASNISHSVQADATNLLKEWDESKSLLESSPEEVNEKRGKQRRIKNRMIALRRVHKDSLTRPS
jgi:hypothetical protein